MPDDLRRELSIATGLEKVIAAALEANKSIVIAGTAGSGKTHLIRMAGSLKKHHVVPDLAALPQTEWSRLFSVKSSVVVAGNEGAFLTGVRKNLPGFSSVIDALHALQTGKDFVGKGPVVIDAAGYDPAGNHAIEKILQLPILMKYVDAKANPQTLAAWKMFTDETVCRRLPVLEEILRTTVVSQGRIIDIPDLLDFYEEHPESVRACLEEFTSGWDLSARCIWFAFAS